MSDIPLYLQKRIIPFSKKENNKSYLFMSRLVNKLGVTYKFDKNSEEYSNELLAIRLATNEVNYADIRYYVQGTSYSRQGYIFHKTYEEFLHYLYSNI